jgi:hypothetical protein
LAICRANPQFPLNEQVHCRSLGGHLAQQKTYWHLLQQRQTPTEYEIVTSKLVMRLFLSERQIHSWLALI